MNGVIKNGNESKRNRYYKQKSCKSIKGTKSIHETNGKIQSHDGKKNRIKKTKRMVLIKEFDFYFLLLSLGILISSIFSASFFGAGMASSYADGLAHSICESTGTCFTIDCNISYIVFLDNITGIIFLGIALVSVYLFYKRLI
jgi:hypothetical protein